MIDVRPVYLCDAVRTPFGRYGGVLSGVRTDDLAAVPIAALRDRNAGVDWLRLDDVVYGCANQAGEDNRNVGANGAAARRACRRKCRARPSTGCADRAWMRSPSPPAPLPPVKWSWSIAGGVESMSRAPFVMNKARRAVRPRRRPRGHHARLAVRQSEDGAGLRHRIRWPRPRRTSRPNGRSSRADQDAFALRSQQRAGAAIAAGRFDDEIVPVTVPQRKGPVTVSADEHPRPDTTLEALSRLKPIVRPDGTVTAGNASGINDGACAILLASEEAVRSHQPDAQGPDSWRRPWPESLRA